MVLNEAKYLWRWGDHLGARDLSQRAWTAWTAERRRRRPGQPSNGELARLHSTSSSVDYAAAACALTPGRSSCTGRPSATTRRRPCTRIGAVAADHLRRRRLRRRTGPLARRLRAGETEFRRGGAVHAARRAQPRGEHAAVRPLRHGPSSSMNRPTCAWCRSTAPTIRTA